MVDKISTIVKCENCDLIKGDIKDNYWLLVTKNDIRVGISLKEYENLMKEFKEILKENLELKLEKAILSKFPIDYEDVKAAVLKEMQNSDKSINEIVEKIKLENPNLFLDLEI